jgi:hypothetical protein
MDSVYNETTGEWVTGDIDVIETQCRPEPSITKGVVGSEDGKTVDYSYTIYMPVQENDIKIGSEVVVSFKEKTILTARVKSFLNGQLHARLWV